MRHIDDPLRKSLLTVLHGLSSVDPARRQEAATLVVVHEPEVWRGALAEQREWLLSSRREREGAWPTWRVFLIAMGAYIVVLVLITALVHALGYRGGSGVRSVTLPFFAVAFWGLWDSRRASGAQVEALLTRVGDDRRLVPLLLASLPAPQSRSAADMSLREAWIGRLARLLPEWHLEETALPSRALARVRRELRYFAGRQYLTDSEAAFLTALLVSLTREAQSETVPDDLGVLARREHGTGGYDPSRVAEAARQARVRLRGTPP